MAEALGGSGTLTGSHVDSDLERLYVDPIYESFICPLTKMLMRDPVTIENGQTFEREAIQKWFRDCELNGRPFTCPITNEQLSSIHLSPSRALRKIIEEWKQRNEAAQLDIARTKLSPESSETELLHALTYIQNLCEQSSSHKQDVRNADIITMIIGLLKNSNTAVRSKALETLRVIVEDDDTNKRVLAIGDTIRTIVKFLPRELTQEREEAVLLLHELSKSEFLSEKIGEVNGAILLLVGIASSTSEDTPTVEKAQQTLENLERCENNVLIMAENGRLQPLLRLLLEGSPETQLLMASHLGEIVLSNDVKVLVAETVGSTLINVLKSGSTQAREAALKALKEISSHDSSARLLIKDGILPPLVKGLFTVGSNQIPVRLKEISAAILSNIVAFGADLESIYLDHRHKTLVSEDVVHNLLHLISNTGPATESHLLQVLVGLTSSQSTVPSIVAAIKSSGATISLIQFIETPQWDIRLAAIKLLHNISPHMSRELSESLCSSTGQLGSLVRVISGNAGISEEQTAAIGLLAELPDRDMGLTRCLLDEGLFPVVVSHITRIRQGETRGIRFVTPYLEGLVRVLSRVTYALDDLPATVTLAIEQNITAIFTDLLQVNGLDNVQTISSLALENLSRQSKHLTKIPDVPDSGICGVMFPCFARKPVITGLCKVHKGICSMRESFCLLERRAVEKLVACLDHTNEKVVESALAALCTLMEDGLDIEQGVLVLCEVDGVKPILEVLQESRTPVLQQKAVWAVERILRSDDIAYHVAGNQNIGTALVEAFRHGDYRTRQIAERALKRVDKLPNFSGIFQKA